MMYKKYQVVIMFQELDEWNNVVTNTAYRTSDIYAETKEQALALLDHKVDRAWVNLKQSILIETVENPDIENGIELK